jgi:hypothetical protein
MPKMFCDAHALIQELTSWNVSNTSEQSRMFALALSLSTKFFSFKQIFLAGSILLEHLGRVVEVLEERD